MKFGMLRMNEKDLRSKFTMAMSAEPVDQRDGGVVDQRDAIPENVAVGRAYKQRALSDGESRRSADADQARLVLAKSVVVRNPQALQRRPRLPLGRDVLALVFADGALSRWSVTRRILCAAGSADECRHGLPHSAADNARHC